MVKTFQEYIDNLDWSKKLYLMDNCALLKGYNDKGEVCTHTSSQVVDVKAKINCVPPVSTNKEDSYYQYSKIKDSWKADDAIRMLYASRLQQVGMISDTEYYKTLDTASDKFNLAELQNMLTEPQLKDACRYLASRDIVFKRLGECLYAADDLDNVDWSLLIADKEEDNNFDYKWFNFIPFNEGLKLIKKDVGVVRHLLQWIRNQDREEREPYMKQIRQLLFSREGLTPKDRDKAIVYIYRDRSVHDFIWEILPIDFRFGKLLGKIYRAKNYKDKAITEEMNSIINCRKCDHRTHEEYELNYAEWTQNGDGRTYRYSRKVRQMAALFRACTEKSYPKSMTGLIGDALYVLKLYDYNWEQVFNAVYGHSAI